MPGMVLPTRLRQLSPTLALRGLRSWTGRQVRVAVVASVLIGLALGVATVLIPNSLFSRDIPPVAWNYPVWVVTSVLSGMLLATYTASRGTEPQQESGGASRSGTVGAVLAWFAVGCPVCNKIALLALGYSGALTWFAPAQPFLAVAALVLLTAALVVRLQGSVHCPVSPTAVRA